MRPENSVRSGSRHPPGQGCQTGDASTHTANPLLDFGGGRVFTSELDMTNDRELLAQYVANRSEEAFRELAERHINLLYSTAVRLVDGDTHRAQDVAQDVFMDLARLASGLSSKVMLGGWLHRHTCFVAAKTMRRERRRQNRERQATEMNALQDHARERFEQIAPILDDAINQLSARDRAAIVLRLTGLVKPRGATGRLSLGPDITARFVY